MRNTLAHQFIKEIIFIPCLRHKINNAVKTSAKNETIKPSINNLHAIAKLCRENRETIKKVCPSHVSTRWIYDFDILLFIKHNAAVVQKVAEIPEEFEGLFKPFALLKNLV